MTVQPETKIASKWHFHFYDSRYFQVTIPYVTCEKSTSPTVPFQNSLTLNYYKWYRSHLTPLTGPCFSIETVFPAIWIHYSDVIMGSIASQITCLTIVYSIVYLSADQRKHQSSALLAFVRGIHRRPVNSPHQGPVTRLRWIPRTKGH